MDSKVFWIAPIIAMGIGFYQCLMDIIHYLDSLFVVVLYIMPIIYINKRI